MILIKPSNGNSLKQEKKLEFDQTNSMRSIK